MMCPLPNRTLRLARVEKNVAPRTRPWLQITHR